VLALEWLDPVFLGGHWVPEMVELAGGEPLLSRPGEKSRQVGWEDLRDLSPDVVVAMPCGYYVEGSSRQAELHWDRLEALGRPAVWAVDAASSFSRPGPRLVEGTELLAHLLHADRVEKPAGVDARLLSATAART
jgi:iron complex transport system substrate-binding protein